MARCRLTNWPFLCCYSRLKGGYYFQSNKASMFWYLNGQNFNCIMQLEIVKFHIVMCRFDAVKHLIQAHSLELRGHLVMFQSSFTFTVNWLMRKSGWI